MNVSNDFIKTTVDEIITFSKKVGAKEIIIYEKHIFWRKLILETIS